MPAFFTPVYKIRDAEARGPDEKKRQSRFPFGRDDGALEPERKTEEPVKYPTDEPERAREPDYLKKQTKQIHLLSNLGENLMKKAPKCYQRPARFAKRCGGGGGRYIIE